MRIIGGRDYYDGAGMGTDTSVVFKRAPAQEAWTARHPLTLPSSEWRHSKPGCLAYGMAMAGGVVLPFAEWRTPSSTFASYWNPYDVAKGDRPARWEPRFVYDIDTAKDLLDGLMGKRAYHPDYKGDASPMDALAAHFATTTLKNDALTWALDHRIATFVLRTLPDGNRRTTLCANTPDLASVEAWHVLDPATAHMRIAGWVGGVLASSKPLVEITDGDRIRKAGFDARSFRKDPGTKRGRSV